MPSELKVNKLSPYTGSTLTIGDSGDTISFASGVLPSLESLTMTGDINLGDNDKAVFGAGSDLQIYHNGSHSFINESGTGNLRILAQNFTVRNPADNESMIIATPDGGVFLYHDNAEKLATTSTGIDVTGTVVSDGLTVDTNTLYVDSANNRVGIGTTAPSHELEIHSISPTIELSDSDDNYRSQITQSGSAFYFDADSGAGGSSSMRFRINGNTEAMRITSSGNVGIGTSSPKVRFQSSGTSIANAPTLGSADADTPIYLTNGDDAYGLLIGNNNSDGHVWLQAQRTDGTATAYNITLNEAGGNVGIGTSSPAQRLHVSSNGNVMIGDIQNKIVTGTGNAGSIYFGTSDVSNPTGAIEASWGTGVEPQIAIGCVRDGDRANIKMYYNQFIEFNTAGNERMRIDSSGDVGIGTSSPDARLEVDGRLRITSLGGGDTSSVIEFKNDDGELGYIFLDNNENYRFENNGSESMRIDSSGRVGIGTTSPNQALEVNGNIRVTGDGIQYTGITGGGTNRFAFIWTNPNFLGRVDNALNVTLGTASDYRLKNNVENLSSVLNKINLLRPITFNAVPLQEGDVVNDVNHIGFIAHEVAEHFPSLVEGEKDAVNDEGNNLYQGLNYAGFTPILTKAIQELKAENDALRSTVADLTTRLEALENA